MKLTVDGVEVKWLVEALEGIPSNGVVPKDHVVTGELDGSAQDFFEKVFSLQTELIDATTMRLLKDGTLQVSEIIEDGDLDVPMRLKGEVLYVKNIDEV